MNTRVLLTLLVVSSCWCCNVRDLTASIITGDTKIGSVLQSNGEFTSVRKDDNICDLCEEYSAEVINYLSDNNTQTEIIKALHKSCSRIPPFKEQCLGLVDYYTPLFFSEVSSIQPDGLCQKFDICEEVVSISQRPSDNKCELCHRAVTEALLKLNDPDTELEVVAILLKACDSTGKNVNKCKRLVFEYAPIILIDADQFLKTNDVCTILHACDPEQDLLTPLHSAS